MNLLRNYFLSLNGKLAEFHFMYIHTLFWFRNFIFKATTMRFLSIKIILDIIKRKRKNHHIANCLLYTTYSSPRILFLPSQFRHFYSSICIFLPVLTIKSLSFIKWSYTRGLISLPNSIYSLFRSYFHWQIYHKHDLDCRFPTQLFTKYQIQQTPTDT